jgi:ADP-ribosyl-[dinitrogen reductase] hydrolase
MEPNNPEMLDRAKGALLGLAVGDAIGTTIEFRTRDSYPHLTDMVGGGPLSLEAGQWTDDTVMALALADSLLSDPMLNESELMTRFSNWHEWGMYSCTGECFDIGITTRNAIEQWRHTGSPFAGSTDPNAADDGSLMRLSPVAICHWDDEPSLIDVAARQSRTRHGAQEAVDACIGYAGLISRAISGEEKVSLLFNGIDVASPKIAGILNGGWRGKARHQVASSRYVAHSLEAALWCVDETSSFEEAVLLAANLGDDANTTAAITGQLAGALYGASAIPAGWLEKLAWRQEIEDVAAQLFLKARLRFDQVCT